MVFSNKLNIIFLLNLIILIQIKASYIILSFMKNLTESDLENDELFEENFVQFFIEPTYYSILEIGTPPQKVELIFSSDNFGLSMIEDENSSNKYFFNKKLSSSLNTTHAFDSNFNIYYYGKNKLVTLTDSIFFSLYDSNSKKISKIEIKEYPFTYLTKNQTSKNYENIELSKEESGKAFMKFGTKLGCDWRYEICEYFPYYFKHEGLINNYIFNVVYITRNKNDKENYDFKLLIGNEQHQESKNQNNEENLKYVNALSYAGELNWIIAFKEVFYFSEGFKLNIKGKDYNQVSLDLSLNDKKLYSYDDRGKMAFDIDVILCPKFYYFTINKTFFGNHTDQCKINRFKKYAVFVCDKNFNTEIFPSIYFYHKDYNYTFILEHNDLFKVIGDKKYFLIVYDLFRPHFWLFGKPFLEKYSFNYNMESKKIGFYKGGINTNKENSNILLINLIWLVIAITIGIAAFFIGKKLFNKIRKKRANELDDDYDYQINSEYNESFNENERKDKFNKKSEYKNKLVD